MADLDDALAAYHKACVELRDRYRDAGRTRADVTRQRASLFANAFSSGESITAAREHADAGVAHLQHDLHIIDAEIQAQLATLRWLDQLIADLRARPL